jgi:hypothetical protein
MKKANNTTIEDVYVFPKEKLYIVFGKGMPVQVIKYDEFGEWNCVKDNDGNVVFDVQIDYDDYWQFQFVDLIHDENGDLKQGLNWNSVKPKIIRKTNSTTFMANLYQNILKSS